MKERWYELKSMKNARYHVENAFWRRQEVFSLTLKEILFAKQSLRTFSSFFNSTVK